MASKYDWIIEVSPDTDEIYGLDCSAWQVIGNGDTIASATITWEPSTTVPGTVGTPFASSPADEFLNVRVTGFVEGTVYKMRAKIVSTGGSTEDFFGKFTCNEPTGF